MHIAMGGRGRLKHLTDDPPPQTDHEYSKWTLWNEIDRRLLNPMKCATDITIFNGYIQRQRLYQFLASLNESPDQDR